MPSFDIVSQLDEHELTNAVDQANREVTTRFDFKGTNASFTLEKETITMKAPSEFQLQQMLEILQAKCVKRDIDIRCLQCKDPESNLSEAKQVVEVQQGIATDKAKKINKMIKDQKLKVQTSIQGDQIRVTGKKRDDLQTTIAFLKDADIEMPLQYINFRD